MTAAQFAEKLPSAWPLPLDFRDDSVHCFQLRDAKWAPASAEKTNYQTPAPQFFARRNGIPIVICQFKRRTFRAHRKNTIRDSLPLQLRNGARMHCLGIRRHILRNELLALCKLLTQSAGVDAGIGLLERTPFHRCRVRKRTNYGASRGFATLEWATIFHRPFSLFTTMR